MDAAAIEELDLSPVGLIRRFRHIFGYAGATTPPAEPAAREAIALFVYRIVRELGSLVAALGGIDALVFSGGISEHDAMTQGRGCRRFAMARRHSRP